MAFDEDMKMLSFLREEEEDPHSISRLSVCCNYDGDEADVEPSDTDEKLFVRGEKPMGQQLEVSDSDKESTGYHSLPATPPRRRRRRGSTVSSPVSGDKAYVSENEAQKKKQGSNNNPRRWRKMRPEYPPWVDSIRRRSGEEQSDYGGGVLVVTRPVGGGKPLCMDLEEVKACKDLGFELEPGRVSYSGSTMDTYTSSGGNSPVSSNHRISSPGDDPNKVKAKLKAWAHAVAFVSTTHHQPLNSS